MRTIQRTLTGICAALILLFICGPVRALPVANLSYTSVSSDTLSLQWDNQVTSLYSNSLSTSSLVGSLLAGISALNQNTTSYSGLTPNTSYTFSVKVSVDLDANIVTISTSTLAKPPTLLDFIVLTTSVCVDLGANGNPTMTNSGIGTNFRLRVSSNGFSSVASSSQGASLSLCAGVVVKK